MGSRQIPLPQHCSDRPCEVAHGPPVDCTLHRKWLRPSHFMFMVTIQHQSRAQGRLRSALRAHSSAVPSDPARAPAAPPAGLRPAHDVTRSLPAVTGDPGVASVRTGSIGGEGRVSVAVNSTAPCEPASQSAKCPAGRLRRPIMCLKIRCVSFGGRELFRC